MPWPEWWNYEIVISPHAIDRMIDRDFTEVDVRALLDDATDFRQSAMPGRFCIGANRDGERWKIVVEPDELERTLIIVTAYPVQ